MTCNEGCEPAAMWEVLSAVSTFVATLVALGASVLALMAPRWNRLAEYLAATEEVLRAVTDAQAIFEETSRLVRDGAMVQGQLAAIRMRAAHQHQTLNRLLDRASLTDGAIVVGSGAMSILNAVMSIETSDEIAAKIGGSDGRAHFVDALTPARVIIDSASLFLGDIERRKHGVQAYAERERKRMGWLQRLVVGRS